MPNPTKSKTKAIQRYRSKRPPLFGPPPLLVGEDAAAYEELHAGIHAAENPIDTVDAIYVAAAAASAWEAQRWNRLKFSLMRGHRTKSLEKFLLEKLELNYDLYKQDFAFKLMRILEYNLPADQAEKLAIACALEESDANDRVEKILAARNSSVEGVLDSVRRHKAEELAKKYARNEPDAVRLVGKILADANLGIDDLGTEELVKGLDVFEHIDRLKGIALARFSASLREIDQRRAARGKNLRIVNGTFVETTTPKGKR